MMFAKSEKKTRVVALLTLAWALTCKRTNVNVVPLLNDSILKD